MQESLRLYSTEPNPAGPVRKDLLSACVRLSTEVVARTGPGHQRRRENQSAPGQLWEPCVPQPCRLRAGKGDFSERKTADYRAVPPHDGSRSAWSRMARGQAVGSVRR